MPRPAEIGILAFLIALRGRNPMHEIGLQDAVKLATGHFVMRRPELRLLDGASSSSG